MTFVADTVPRNQTGTFVELVVTDKTIFRASQRLGGATLQIKPVSAYKSI